MTAATERWLPIPGYESYYEVSDLGRIRSRDRTVVTRGRGTRLFPGQILAFGTYKRTGHKHVTFCVARKARTFTVHSVVMLAFVGLRPEGLEIRHLNGIPHDNHLSNLVYGTAAENAADRDHEHGRNFESNKTRCPQNHEYTEENTYWYNGARQCRTCRNGGRPAGECSKPGCQDPVKSLGVCDKHYMQQLRANRTEEQKAEARKKDADRAREKRRQMKCSADGESDSSSISDIAS